MHCEKLISIGFEGYGQLSADQVHQIEVQICFNMPEDYKSFLITYNGGQRAEHMLWCITSPNISEKLFVDALLGFNVENKTFDLVTWYNLLGYEYEGVNAATIALSDPGVIVLINEPGHSGVYLWDDSLELETSTEDDCMYKIADTFDEFISKIYVEKLKTL